MNWTIRSVRRAPTALRTPTSTERRAARAVIRVTKLIAAMVITSRPTAAMPASTVRSPGGRSPSPPWRAVKWRPARDRRWNFRDEAPLAAGKCRLAKAGIPLSMGSAEAPGFSFT